MNDDVKALVDALEAWAPLVSSGYEVPAAGQTMMNASRALTAQADEIERLRAALIEEREDNLWEAYNSGNVKDGQWTHMFMSDGEWLARECGLDPSQGYYDDAEVRAAIPRAALKAAQEVKA